MISCNCGVMVHRFRAHSFAAPEACRVTREGGERGLGGGVAGRIQGGCALVELRARGYRGVHGCNVDDGTAALLFHPDAETLGGLDRPVDTALEIALPLVEGRVFQRALGDVEACGRAEFVRVVDEDVDGLLFRGDAVAEVVEGSDAVHVDLMYSDFLRPELIGPARGLLLESRAASQGDNARLQQEA